MEARPKPPSRETTLTEMTTLEKIWGKLFEEGRPTKRLGQLLRGIAVHLVSMDAVV
jgi:predicted phosphohydrolase